MIRTLLLLTVTAAAALALSAGAASAVVVNNPGMHELEAENTLSLAGVHTPIGFITGWTCDLEWEAEVGSTGAFEFHDITIHPGHADQVGPCDTTDDCDNAGWHDGQIEEAGPDQFTLHYTYCLEGQGGQFDGVDVPVECPIADTEIHCDYTIGTQQTPFGTSNVEVLGEMTFHDSLDLGHEEG